MLGGPGFGYLSGAAGHQPDPARRRLHPRGRGGDRLQLLRRPRQRRRHRHRRAAPSSTTWCTSGTTSASAQRCLIMAGVGIAGQHPDRGRRDPGGPRRRHRSPGDRRPAPGSRPRAPCSATSRPAHPSAAIRRGRTASSSGPRRRSTGWPRSSPTSSGWCRTAPPRWLGGRWPGRAVVTRHRPAHRAATRPRAASARRPGRASSSGGSTCPARPTIPARVAEVQSTERRTALGDGEACGPDGRAPAGRGRRARARRPDGRARRARAADRRRLVHAVPRRPDATPASRSTAGRAGDLPGDWRRSSWPRATRPTSWPRPARSGSRPRSSGPIR